MKRIFFFLIFIQLVTISFGQIVNGELFQIEDKTVLKIWGTHQERGFAYGYLQAEEIMDVMENYILGYNFSNSIYYYGQALDFFQENYVIATEFEQEAHGMISGIEAAGFSLFSSVLNRDLDADDVLLANAIVDLSIAFDFLEDQLHCSSLSSWGNSTLADPILQGESVITRLLDWNPHQTLLDNQIIIVQIPAETDEQSWISFAFAGLIGALSGINENRIAAFMDVGNFHTHPDPTNLNPIFFSIRSGLEKNDYNNNGENNPNDVFSAISSRNHLSGSITHVLASTQKDSCAIVVECNNQNGAMVRTAADNTAIDGENLAATNHFRTLYSPVYCNRYSNIVDSLNANSEISISRSWELLSGAAGVYGNIQAIEFIPTTDDIYWSTSPANTMPAYTLQPTNFLLYELFQTTSLEQIEIPKNETILLYPNPINFLKSNLNIRFGKNKEVPQKIDIYNVKGQLIKNVTNERSYYSWDGRDSNNKRCSNGVYFLKATFRDGNNTSIKFNVVE